MEWIVTGDQNLNKRRWDPVQKKQISFKCFQNNLIKTNIELLERSQLKYSVQIYPQHLLDTGREKQDIHMKEQDENKRMNHDKRLSDTTFFHLSKTRLTGDNKHVKEHQMISCSLVHQWQELFMLSVRKKISYNVKECNR